MLNYILLLISLALGTGKNLFSKWGEKSFGSLSGLMSVNILTSLLAVLVFAVSGAHLSAADPLFLVLALLYGALTLGSQSFYITAVKGGSVAICSLIYAASFILPTVYSVIRTHEIVPLTKAGGILLMMLAVVLVSLKQKSGADIAAKKGSSQIWLAFLAMLCAGSVGIIQKVFGGRYPSEMLNTFLLMAFLSMLVFSLLGKLAAALCARKTDAPRLRYDRHFLLPAILLALCVVFTNRLNLLLVAALPGIVFFPLINGGTIMLSAVGSGVFFHEKIIRRTWIGILIGLVAIVLIAL